MEIATKYFEWLYSMVCKDDRYRSLCDILFDREFTYTISMDGNRYEDGIDLRYRFGRDNDIPHPIIADVLDCRPCSIFEMMVALALRCEEEIMTNDEYGDRTYIWFGDMLKSLGLFDMINNRIDPDYVYDVLDNFLAHKYAPNGKGGLFTLNHSRFSTYDLRYVEIWYQAMWYLAELEKEN